MSPIATAKAGAQLIKRNALGQFQSNLEHDNPELDAVKYGRASPLRPQRVNFYRAFRVSLHVIDYLHRIDASKSHVAQH